MNIKSCFLRWGIPLLLLAAFLAAVFALNRVDKVALVIREGQTFEKGVVVDILQDNLMPDGSRVGEQRVLVRMTTGVRAGQELETTSADPHPDRGRQERHYPRRSGQRELLSARLLLWHSGRDSGRLSGPIRHRYCEAPGGIAAGSLHSERKADCC